jgi:23S rRNA pseudouridine1911/1915/1917 synthase
MQPGGSATVEQLLDWTVDDLAPGEHPRLDRYLALHLVDHSRSAIQRWIAEGLVTVNGQPTKASRKLADGEQVRLVIPPPVPDTLIPEARPLSILYEDGDILVLNKAAGEVVHPAPGHRTGTLVHAILAHCSDLAGVGGKLRPGVVHRLDKDTSGVLLVAKNDLAFRRLQEQFKGREVRKTYLALVAGRLAQPRGVVDAPIGRDPKQRKRMAVVSWGRPAVTRYRVLRAVGDASLLEVQPLTGRTHQIRVHLAFLGHPVVGDAVYARRGLPRIAPRQFLHAWRIAFRHPTSDEEIEFRAPLPPDLLDVWHQVVG